MSALSARTAGGTCAERATRWSTRVRVGVLPCTVRLVLLPLALLIALEASTDPLTWLINYGIAGVVILLLVTGKLRTSAEVDNLKQALVQAREDLASRDKALHDLTVQITNNTLPSMNALADVIEAQPVRADNNQLAAVLTRMDEVLGKIDALEKGSP